MNDQDYWTIKAMKIYGGGFVKALAEAASQADPENLRKIMETWPKYWRTYMDMGERLRLNSK